MTTWWRMKKQSEQIWFSKCPWRPIWVPKPKNSWLVSFKVSNSAITKPPAISCSKDSDVQKSLLRRELACCQAQFIQGTASRRPSAASSRQGNGLVCGEESNPRCAKSPFPSLASHLESPVANLHLKSFPTCASVHLLPSWPHLSAEGNGTVWMAWWDNEEYSRGPALPVWVPGQWWVPLVRIWGAGREMGGMWRRQATDWTPSYKRRLYSTHRALWDLLHLLPRQGPGSKASDPLGQHLPPPHLRQWNTLTLPFLILWQTRPCFNGMSVLPGYPWPWHTIPRNQVGYTPFPPDPLIGHALRSRSLCVAHEFAEAAQQSYADVWETDRVALLGQQKNLGHRLRKKVPSPSSVLVLHGCHVWHSTQPTHEFPVGSIRSHHLD